MGKTKTKPIYPRGITFEQVWAALMEDREMLKETDRIVKENAERQRKTDLQLKKSRKDFKQELKESREKFDQDLKKSREEFDQGIKKSREEFDQDLKKSREEYERQVKDYNKRFGDFTNRFGEVVEYMIAPNMQEKFRDLGLDFPKSNRNTVVSDVVNRIFLEIDVFLENSDKAILVEIKTKLTTENVKEHIERLEKMRTYANLHGDKRSFLGAAAGVVMTPNVKEFALKQGLFVVEPSGESLNITSPDGKPKEW